MTAERKTAPLILVVEDYDDAREMYVEYLTFTGFRVESATNGLEAIEMTQRLKPDLVLMDLALPKLDGWEATRRLKSDPATAHIPVIALTGHALAGHAERARGGLRFVHHQAMRPRRARRRDFARAGHQLAGERASRRGAVRSRVASGSAAPRAAIARLELYGEKSCDDGKEGPPEEGSSARRQSRAKRGVCPGREAGPACRGAGRAG